MKHTWKWMALTLALVLVFAAGCGKKAAGAAGGEGTPGAEQTGPVGTDDPSGTTLAAGVENWDESTIQRPTQRPEDQQTGNQQTGNQSSDVDVSGNKTLTIEEYESLSPADRQKYFESFETVEAFYEWLEKAEANRKNDNTVTGDGSLNLGDYINGNP